MNSSRRSTPPSSTERSRMMTAVGANSKKMPIMNWSGALDVGVDAMNKEHQEILAAMNAIYDAYAARTRGPAMNALVATLGDLCVQHFADEEKFMQETGYPGLKTHKIVHENLLYDFMRHAAVIRADGGKANDEFFGFLQSWLIAHIKGADSKYGAARHFGDAAA